MIADKMYRCLERQHVSSSKQTGCLKGSCRTKDQLLTDKTKLQDCKRRGTNPAKAWIDYKKAYGMASHSWIGGCLKKLGIAENEKNFLKKNMKSRIRVEFIRKEITKKLTLKKGFSMAIAYSFCCLSCA